jgi:hypothetical protein
MGLKSILIESARILHLQIGRNVERLPCRHGSDDPRRLQCYCHSHVLLIGNALKGSLQKSHNFFVIYCKLVEAKKIALKVGRLYF